MDRLHKVVITGYVMQKDYMDTPDNWDWTHSSTYMGLFLDTPEVTVKELEVQEEVDEYVEDGWDLADSYNIKIEELQEELATTQRELRVSDAEVDSLLEQNEILYSLVPDGAMDIPDSVPLDVQGGTPLHNPEILECDICSSGRGMVEYPFNPVPEDSTLLDWPWGAPKPYPYTHPLREIPDHSRVKVK